MSPLTQEGHLVGKQKRNTNKFGTEP